MYERQVIHGNGKSRPQLPPPSRRESPCGPPFLVSCASTAGPPVRMELSSWRNIACGLARIGARSHGDAEPERCSTQESNRRWHGMRCRTHRAVRAEGTGVQARPSTKLAIDYAIAIRRRLVLFEASKYWIVARPARICIDRSSSRASLLVTAREKSWGFHHESDKSIRTASRHVLN